MVKANGGIVSTMLLTLAHLVILTIAFCLIIMVRTNAVIHSTVMLSLAHLAILAVAFCLMMAASVLVARRGGPRLPWFVWALFFAFAVSSEWTANFLLQPPVLREVRQFEGHSSVVSRVAISADGRRCLSTSSGYVEEEGEADDSVRVWDVATGQELRRLKSPDQRQVHSLAISSDGRRALTGGHDYVRLWDLDNGEVLQHMKADQPNDLAAHDAHGVAFSPNGEQALSGGWDGAVRLWDLETGQEVRVLLPNAKRVTSVAFAPDGRRVAAGSGSGKFKKNRDDNFVQVWDLATGEEMHRLKTDQETATCLAFSADGQRLLAASRYGFVARLWDLNSGEEVHRFKGEWYLSAVAFSPDGQQALCLDRNFAMSLWDVTRGKEVGRAATRRGDDDRMECAAFAANGRYAVSGDRNRTMWLWELPE